MIISAFTIIGLHGNHRFSLDHYYFMSDYLLKQSEALCSRETVVCDKGITFNSMGHVNQGRTIRFADHELIIHLGNGYAFFR